MGCLRGLERDEIERGEVLAKSGSIEYTKFSAQVYVLTKEEGGRRALLATATARSSTCARPT